MTHILPPNKLSPKNTHSHTLVKDTNPRVAASVEMLTNIESQNISFNADTNWI